MLTPLELLYCQLPTKTMFTLISGVGAIFVRVNARVEVKSASSVEVLPGVKARVMHHLGSTHPYCILVMFDVTDWMHFI